MRIRMNRMVAALVAAWPAAVATGATYNVNNTAELDQAIIDSNANPGADIINIAPGVYTPSAGFPISDDLTVNGGGQPGAVLDQGNIWVDCNSSVGIKVTINDLTVRNSNKGLRVGCAGTNPPTEVRVNGSLFVGNQTGIYLSGDYSGGVVTVTNSTLTGNGHGVFLETGQAQEPVTLRNLTVVGNQIGIYAIDPPTFPINSIVAGNFFADCYQDISCSAGNPGPLRLGPLADNGGPTRTHAPRPGSSAIDASICPLGMPDQRGVARPVGDGCDLGAVEAVPLPATLAADKGSFINLTAVPESVLPTGNGKPAGVTFPYGFIAFTINGVTPGDTVLVSIEYSAPIPTGAQYWKVIDGIWTDVTSLLGDDDGDNVLTLSITDGGLGDEDGVANGVIVDPGGVGVPEGGGGPSCDGQQATIFVHEGVIVGGPLDGQAYAGFLQGTSGSDVMVGTDAPDRIFGRGGNDTVCGGAGNDWLAGEDGNDMLLAEAGRDFLDGGTGDDTLEAGDGDDALFGGLGHGADSLSGGPGRDILNGWFGVDQLNGGAEFDFCFLGETYIQCEAQIP